MLIRYSRMHIRFSGDDADAGPHKFHYQRTPRIGGGAPCARPPPGPALLVHQGYFGQKTAFYMAVSIIPVFLVGLLEDLTKQISPQVRLIASFLAAALAFWLLGAELRRLSIPGLDGLLELTPIAFAVS